MRTAARLVPCPGRCLPQSFPGSCVGRSGVGRSEVGRSCVGRSCVGRSGVGRSGLGRSDVCRSGVLCLVPALLLPWRMCGQVHLLPLEAGGQEVQAGVCLAVHLVKGRGQIF